MLGNLVEAHRASGLLWPHWEKNEDPETAPLWKIIETRRTLRAKENQITQAALRTTAGDIRRGWGSDIVARPYGDDPSDWPRTRDAFSEANELEAGIGRWVSSPVWGG